MFRHGQWLSIQPGPLNKNSPLVYFCQFLKYACCGVNVRSRTADTAVDDCDIHCFPIAPETKFCATQGVQIGVRPRLCSIKEDMRDRTDGVRVRVCVSTSPKGRCVVGQISHVRTAGVCGKRKIRCSSAPSVRFALTFSNALSCLLSADSQPNS